MEILFWLNNLKIFNRTSLLIFSTRNSSSDQKMIQKFKEESPKSVKRTKEFGSFKILG